jgi:glycosyltransferase involved in cell wall biosynthesis
MGILMEKYGMPLKLLIISDYSDTWNSVRPEAEMLIGMVALGIDLTLMTQGDAEYVPRFLEQGVKVIDFHPQKKLQWSSIKRIRKELKQGEYDAVYLFNNKAITNTLFAAIGLAVKTVSYRGQTGNIYRYDPSAYLTHLHPRLDGILCVANAVRDDLHRRSFLPKQRIQTVYKGHDLSWYQNTPTDLTQFGIPHDAFVVGCVANNRPRKGVSVLLRATHYLPPESNIHLLLVGEGMDSHEINEQIKVSPMANRIHVVGFRRDAPELVAACDISVLPSIKREGLPKTVIEAMVYGKPSVVSDTGGNAELVIDSETGLVVAPNSSQQLSDAVLKLWNNPVLCQAMGQKGKQRIHNDFHTSKSALQTKTYFENLINS